MKSRYLPLLAALLTIGTLGAFASATAAPIEHYSLSGTHAAAISPLAEINAIQQIDISEDSSAPRAIANTILARDIQRITIAESQISDTSLIAIANIFEAHIADYQIAGGAITEIAA